MTSLSSLSTYYPAIPWHREGEEAVVGTCVGREWEMGYALDFARATSGGEASLKVPIVQFIHLNVLLVTLSVIIVWPCGHGAGRI